MRIFFLSVLLALAPAAQAQQDGTYDATVVKELAFQLRLELEDIVDLLDSSLQPEVLQVYETAVEAREHRYISIDHRRHIAYVFYVQAHVFAKDLKQLLGRTVAYPEEESAERRRAQTRGFALLESIRDRSGYFKQAIDPFESREICSPYECSDLVVEFEQLEELLDDVLKSATITYNTWADIHY